MPRPRKQMQFVLISLDAPLVFGPRSFAGLLQSYKQKRRGPIPPAPSSRNRDWRLLLAAEEAGYLPAAAFLAVADLIVADRVERVGGDEAGLAGRCHDLQHRAL